MKKKKMNGQTFMPVKLHGRIIGISKVVKSDVAEKKRKDKK